MSWNQHLVVLATKVLDERAFLRLFLTANDHTCWGSSIDKLLDEFFKLIFPLRLFFRFECLCITGKTKQTAVLPQTGTYAP